MRTPRGRCPWSFLLAGHGDDLRDLLGRERRLAAGPLFISEERQHQIVDVGALTLVRFCRRDRGLASRPAHPPPPHTLRIYAEGRSLRHVQLRVRAHPYDPRALSDMVRCRVRPHDPLQGRPLRHRKDKNSLGPCHVKPPL